MRGLENSSVVKPHCIAHLLSNAYETHFCTEVLVLSNNFIHVLCTRVTLDKLCCTDKIIFASDSNAKDFPFLNWRPGRVRCWNSQFCTEIVVMRIFTL